LGGAGLLTDERFERLESAGIRWEPSRTRQDEEWDDLIALLLQVVQIGGEGGPAEGAAEPVGLPPRLVTRLHEACTAWKAGQLPASQAAQLQAFGFSPDSPLPPIA
jgi:hypothetical protein